MTGVETYQTDLSRRHTGNISESKRNWNSNRFSWRRKVAFRFRLLVGLAELV